jgi:LPS export ABC transporter protein LptC
MNWRWISLAALLGALVIGYGALVERSPTPTSNNTQAEQRGNDNITLKTVRVNFFQSSTEQSAPREWLLSARQGLVPANFRVVQLFGDVVLRPADAQPTAFLRADALAIDTQTNIAYSTSSPVHVRFGGHSMVVKSFRADLTNEKVRLESVNGRFDPQQQQ